MSKSDNALTVAKIAGLFALAGLAGYGAYVQAEAEAATEATDDLATRFAKGLLTEEYTFSGIRRTNENTVFVLHVVGKDEQFIDIALQQGEQALVIDTNLPGVKVGKAVVITNERLSAEVDRYVRTGHSYYATDRRVRFFSMPFGQRNEAFLFEVLKKGEFVPMFLANTTDMTLSVL
jgi:hypothetical protein